MGVIKIFGWDFLHPSSIYSQILFFPKNKKNIKNRIYVSYSKFGENHHLANKYPKRDKKKYTEGQSAHILT